MSKRDAKEYAVEKTVHTLKVLESLDGTLREPVTIKRVVERTKLQYDAVRSILITLKLNGWAAQNEQGLWMLGTKLMRFGENFNDVVLSTIRR